MKTLHNTRNCKYRKFLHTKLKHGKISGKFYKFICRSFPYRVTAREVEICVRMVLDLGAQIERLKESGYGLLNISSKQVHKTSSGAFILSDKRDLYYKCTTEGMLDIIRPFKKEDSMAPEVLAIDNLPSEVSYTAAYYSLGNLACDVLGIDRDISLLKPTKLFFLLERCMQEDPSSRVFLFI